VQFHFLDVLEPHEHLLEGAMLPEDARDGLLADSELRHLDSGKPEAKTCGNSHGVAICPPKN
jgi:hypothetical protein